MGHADREGHEGDWVLESDKAREPEDTNKDYDTRGSGTFSTLLAHILAQQAARVPAAPRPPR